MVSAAWEKKGRHAVLAPSWIGDTAMAAPFFASLRAAFPEAHILKNPFFGSRPTVCR